MLGVSRTSLREAVRVLATVGVIDVRHGNGMYVLSPTPVYTGSKVVFDATEQFALRNLIETRRGIEVTAVTAAIERGAEEDFEALDAMLDEQQRALGRDENFVWDPLHFELAVIEITGNSWLYDVELMLRDSWSTLSSGLRRSVGRYSEWHAEHRAILASLRSRNVKQAQRLVITHLSLERFEEDLKSRGSAASASVETDNS
jgi:GntR family transcriptional repressor for pyruvate dehydrogenase complex